MRLQFSYYSFKGLNNFLETKSPAQPALQEDAAQRSGATCKMNPFGSLSQDNSPRDL